MPLVNFKRKLCTLDCTSGTLEEVVETNGSYYLNATLERKKAKISNVLDDLKELNELRGSLKTAEHRYKVAQKLMAIQAMKDMDMFLLAITHALASRTPTGIYARFPWAP